MKTKNKTQKTVLKSLAIITSFLLISLTVSAQEFWHSIIENGTAKEMALAIIDNNKESNLSESSDLISTVVYSETESENKMELEEWMTNNKVFNVKEKPEKRKVIKTSTFVFEETKESKLKFEAWMFNPKCWKARK